MIGQNSRPAGGRGSFVDLLQSVVLNRTAKMWGFKPTLQSEL